MALFGKTGRSEIISPQEYMPVEGADFADGHHNTSCSDTLVIKRLKFRLRITVVLLCTTLAALIPLTFLTLSNYLKNYDSRVGVSGLSGTLSPVPSIPFTTTTFEQNTSFTTHPSPDSDAAWNSLLPPGRGYVFVKDPESYNLQPGETTQWGEIYSVSLFHQLHCLGELRKVYWLLLDSISLGETRRVKQLQGPGGEHVGHCLDYLRQSIICSGDMSLEWPRVEADGRRFQVDGWGITHECKSWDAISEYMQQNHFNYSANSNIAP